MALRLRGATSGYTELKAPASAGDNTLTLPTNNGSSNQLLKTDGNGNLSWTDDNSGVSLSGSTNNTIATVTGANALQGEANLTFDGTTLTASTDIKVQGGSGDTTFILHRTNAAGGNDNSFGNVRFTDNNNNEVAGIRGCRHSAVDDAYLQFLTRSAGGSITERFRLSPTNDIATFTGSNSGTLTFRNDTSNEMQIHSGGSDALIFGTGGENERLRITSSGALLVGTATPYYGSGDMQHEIRKDNNRTYTAPLMSSHSHLFLNNSDTTTNAFCGLGVRAGSGDGSLGFVYTGSANSADFVINTDGGSNGVERLRITNAGNVGIGETSPDTWLHIKGGTSNNVLKLESTDGTCSMEFFDNATTSGNQPIVGCVGNNLYSETGGSERLRIHSNGNISINKTTANCRVDIDSTHYVVTDSGKATTGINIDGTSGNADEYGGGISFQCGATAAAAIAALQGGADADNVGLAFFTHESGTGADDAVEQMRIRNDGDILFYTNNNADNSGVGYKFKKSSSIPYMTITTNSSSASHSNYHIYNTNGSYSGYRWYGRIDGGLANYQSNNVDLCDEREKKAIADAPSQLTTIKSWKIRNFRYNEQEDSEPLKIGVIAQEIELVNPELVDNDFKVRIDDSGNEVLRKGVKEQQMMMISIKALQEAIDKIETLETKVAALESA